MMEENNNQEEIQKNENVQNEEVVSETVVESTVSAEEVTKENEKKGGIKKFFSGKSVGKIAGIVAAVVVIVLIFGAFLSRSPKAAVKQFVSGMNSKNAKKVMDVLDMKGSEAYSKARSKALSKSSSSSSLFSSSSKSSDVDMSEFDEVYKDILKEYKDMDSDEKKDYKEELKKVKESLQDNLDDLKEEKVKIKAKVTKVSKVKGSKLLKKVTADVTVKKDGDQETKTVTFYTVKKGLKNYVVYADLLSSLIY